MIEQSVDVQMLTEGRDWKCDLGLILVSRHDEIKVSSEVLLKKIYSVSWHITYQVHIY
jgi:hypothetical protein